MSDLPLLVFDVNETLLDIEILAPRFERVFGDPGAMRQWFAQLVLYAEALTLSGGYAPFGEVGGAVLRMVGAVRGREVSDDDVQQVKDAIATMPAHPEVPAALSKLRSAGFHLFAFTNNPLATCSKQLDHAGLTPLFERQFSVDEGARRYKPALEAYRAVEQALGVPPPRLCLVACHAWDTLGAAAAGWDAALVVRPGNAPFGLGAQPGIVGADMNVVADALIQRAVQGR